MALKRQQQNFFYPFIFTDVKIDGNPLWQWRIFMSVSVGCPLDDLKARSGYLK